ncbi:MAG: DMT family transporter [Anaerolineaceae bacterium]|nr:DMT family transporter [Anaerolineaceae bacterium]
MSVKNWVRLVGLGFIWGTSYSWVKVAVAELNPAVLVGFRTLLGALGLFVFLQFDRKGRLNWREITPLLGVFVLLGLFNVALPFFLISWSEVHIDSSMTAILMSTGPLFTVLVASFFLPEERFSLPRLAGLLVGFGGVIILILPAAKHGATSSVLGYIAALLASLSYAVAGVYARKKTRGPSPVVQAFLQLCMAAAWLWAFIALTKQPVHIPSAPLTWAAIIWLGLLGSTLAYILFFALLHSVGATRTSLVSYITPLVSVTLGVVFLTERLQWQSVLGGLLIISGIAVINYKNGTSSSPGPA